MKNWRIILTLWIGLGIATSGYFYLFPLTERTMIPAGTDLFGNYYSDHWADVKIKTKRFEVSVLVTIVGSIIIFGFGKYYKKE